MSIVMSVMKDIAVYIRESDQGNNTRTKFENYQDENSDENFQDYGDDSDDILEEEKEEKWR